MVMAVCAALVFATGAAPGPGSGTVKGKVTFEGTPPPRKLIDMSKESSCARMYSTPPLGESVVTGPGNALADVVVYISAGAPEETAPSIAVKMTQKGCRYSPHVIAFQVNQELWVANDDPAVHNVFAQAKVNPPSNKSQLPGALPVVERFAKPEFIPVKCNVHPWMHGTFAVLKNSHYAVTAPDGVFSLPNLQPGKYTITAWQESYGEQSQEVTITVNETKTIDFKFKANP